MDNVLNRNTPEHDRANEPEQRVVEPAATVVSRSTWLQRTCKGGRVGKRCYYVFFILLSLAVVIGNVTSFTFVAVVQVEFTSIPKKVPLFSKCILFAKESTSAGKSIINYTVGVWACNFVLAADLVVMAVTMAMFIVYIILIVKGVKLLSGCRILDMAVFLVLAALSGTVGIILHSGNCTLSDDTCKTVDPYLVSFITAALYVSYGVAVAYFAFFIWKLVMVICFCMCYDKIKGRKIKAGERTPLVNPNAPNVYSRPRESDAEAFQEE